MKQLRGFFLYLREKNWRALLLLFLVTFTVHSPVLFNGYNLDDELVTRNHRLTSKGISAIPEIYKSPYYEDEMGYSYGYRPTVLASFSIENELFGESAFVGHLINLLLYALTVIVIFSLILNLFPGQWWLAFGTAILFAVHPIHTEVVASIKNRDEILSMLFGLLGIWSFIKLKAKSQVFGLVLLLFSFYLSITSKFSGVYLFIWMPLVFRNQMSTAASRVVFYAAMTIVTGLVLEIRQPGVEQWKYPILLLATFSLIEFLLLIRCNAKKVNLNRIKGFVFTPVQSLIRIILRTVFERVRKIEVQIKKNLNGAKNWCTDQSKTLWKSALLRLQKTQSILHLDRALFYPIVILLVITWNPFVVIMIFLLPSLWSRLSSDQKSFASDYKLPIISLSALITATNIFTPFLVAFYFGKIAFTEKKQPMVAQTIGHLIWSIFIGFDLFILGDTNEFPDRVLFLVYAISLITQPFFTHILCNGDQKRAVSLQLITVLISFGVLYLSTHSVEHIWIFLSLNGITVLGYASNILNPSRVANYTTRIVGLIVIVHTFSFSMSTISALKRDLLNSEVYPRITSNASLFELQKLLDRVATFTLLSKRAAEFDSNTIPALSYLKTVREPVAIPKTENELKAMTEIKTSGKSSRPLDYVENPIVYFADFHVKLGTALSTVSWILKKTVIPFPQSFYYGYNEVPIRNLLENKNLLSIGLLSFVLLLIAYTLSLKQLSTVGLGIVFWLGGAFLFSGLMEQLPGMLAERFVYLSSLGFCLTLVALGTYISDKSAKFKVVTPAIACLVLMSSSAYSFHRNTLWKDKVTLMRNDIKNVPNSAQAHNLLAHALMEDVFDRKNKSSATEKEQQIIEAEHHFSRATEIYPFFFNAWVDKGKVNEQLNKPEEVIECYQQALSIDSTYTPLFNWIGKNFELLGNYNKAAEYYQNYLLLHPNDFVNYDNLARVLFRQNKFDEAIRVCEEYLKMDSSNQIFIDNIAFMKQQMENADSFESNAE